jgi:hypothetical protein
MARNIEIAFTFSFISHYIRAAIERKAKIESVPRAVASGALAKSR